jgi:hypothetical protein
LIGDSIECIGVVPLLVPPPPAVPTADGGNPVSGEVSPPAVPRDAEPPGMELARWSPSEVPEGNVEPIELPLALPGA